MAAGHIAMLSPRQRDLVSGMLCLVGGGLVLLEARKDTIGSLASLGPGFYPAVLGVLLALVGVLIVATALTASSTTEDPDTELIGGPDWRGCACIVAAVVAFITVAWLAGLAPAIFACAFVGALGDRSASWRGSLVLALAMSIAGTVLFGYLLGINMPLWQWPWAA
jgi:hypothetical protein